MNEELKETEQKIIDPNTFVWRIPECCKDLRADCKHVVKKQPKEKRNIGL